MSDVVEVPLHEQLDQSTPEYINTRIMFLEQEFQNNPRLLENARNKVTVLKAKLRTTEAHARLRADAKSADLRSALMDVDPEVVAGREEVAVAESELLYLKDLVHESSKELNALQTRSANSRAEISLAGRGRP